MGARNKRRYGARMLMNCRSTTLTADAVVTRRAICRPAGGLP